MQCNIFELFCSIKIKLEFSVRKDSQSIQSFYTNTNEIRVTKRPDTPYTEESFPYKMKGDMKTRKTTMITTTPLGLLANQ